MIPLPIDPWRFTAVMPGRPPVVESDDDLLARLAGFEPPTCTCGRCVGHFAPPLPLWWLYPMLGDA